MSKIDFQMRPILVFWETTRACLLACKHCRAEAMANSLPGELSRDEGLRFVESLTQFGRPYPVLILTGGDILMRPDVFEFAARAGELGVPIGLAPSVTPLMTDENIERMAAVRPKVVSISLDGATPATQEGIRGITGHFRDTVDTLRRLVAAGFHVQVNTVIMQDNVLELPAIFQTIKEIGVKIWEVFFLIPVGRGHNMKELSPQENEDIAHFLYEASAYGVVLRTVEGPFFRRVARSRHEQGDNPLASPSRIAEKYRLGPLYLRLAEELRGRLGQPMSGPIAPSVGTRDGKGVIFVAHDGTVYPAGFLPVSLGNIRETSLISIYRESSLLQEIRAARFAGKCGICEYRDSCGGSRARAYASTGDALQEDPACAYNPSSA